MSILSLFLTQQGRRAADFEQVLITPLEVSAMALETWLAFFVACWVISLSPGAGAIASMSAGLQYGFWR
ncbi:MAG TPA: hypothetical protein VJ047_17410, partial [Pseudomonas sp.]|nr:hypothetical protein [Pseudomonas sp.]